MAPDTGLTAVLAVVDRSIESSEGVRYIRRLVKAGASVEGFDRALGSTPLMGTVFMNRPGEVEALIELGARIDAKSLGVNGFPVESALDIAKRMYYGGIVKILEQAESRQATRGRKAD